MDEPVKDNWRVFRVAFYIMVVITAIYVLSGCTAQAYTVDQYADAIYKSEGGGKIRHPYGILKTYKHTTARQACKNTIIHQHRLWWNDGHRGDFVAYLGAKYAPVGCNNDVGTNKYWVKNVNWWLLHG